MRKLTLTSLVMVLLASAVVSTADDKPMPSGPAKEHAWLKQLVGEWDSESEINFEEGKPPTKCKGSQKVKMIGEFWALSEGKSDVFGTAIEASWTLGYDEKEKVYVGTWVDSMFNHLWHYKAKLDSTGKILALESEGPCPGVPGKTSKFKDVIEIKDKDYHTWTSMMQGDDGKWTTMGVTHFRRKK